MGAYLSVPITTKETSTEENELMAVASCSMQGWRVTQEDAHNAILKYDTNSSLFAVYDGHGGHEVAKYSAQHLPDFIKNNEDYRKGNIDKALVDSFVEFDRTMTEAGVINELKRIAGTDGDDDEHDPAEVDHLYQEATMPIEEVVAKYGRAEDDEADTNGDVPKKPKDGESSAAALPKKLLAHPVIAELMKKSSRKPISPYLRGKTVSRLPAESGDESGKANDSKDLKEVKDEEDDPDKTVELDAVEKKSEQKDSNGDEAGVAVKSENGAEKSNGHSKVEDDEKTVLSETESAKPVVVNGESNCVSVKGKGKGKGKSSMAKIAAAAENNHEEEAPAPVVVPKKKSTKSAEELYKHVLVADSDGDDEDLDDEEDENFGEDGEDSDDYEDMDSEEEEDGEDEEEDSDDDEDEEEEDEDEMNGELTGGNGEPGNDSGCTAVVALIRGNKLYVANAGDSRCIVCREGKAIEMSADHKPEDLPEMERIEKAGGRVTPDGRVNGGLNLSRALGDHGYKTNKSLPLTEQMISPVPDIKTLSLDPKLDSYVFLACDGIWNSLSSQEVVNFINERFEEAKDDSPETLKSICIQLFEHCLAPDTAGDGTGCDNMTAVLIKLKPEFGKLQEENSECSKRLALDNEADDEDVELKQAPKKIKLDEEKPEESAAAALSST